MPNETLYPHESITKRVAQWWRDHWWLSLILKPLGTIAMGITIYWVSNIWWISFCGIGIMILGFGMGIVTIINSPFSDIEWEDC